MTGIDSAAPEPTSMDLPAATAQPDGPTPKVRLRIGLLGATGTIGRATADALLRRGHDVVCLVRPRANGAVVLPESATAGLPGGLSVRTVDVCD
ncbi:MAG: NAD-dependent epimerase/dehydratase family protein, partial [Hyphomicrobiales bacterium]